jgi:hypothetical protein
MREGDNRARDEYKHKYDGRNYDYAFAPLLLLSVSVAVHICLLQNS